MNSLRLAIVGALFTALAACGSTPPNNYYVLTAEVNAAANAQTPSIGVGPITIPEYLNRNSMVFQQSGNQLDIEKSERWAEPLTDGILRVMSINLGSALGTQNVQGFPWSPGQTPDYGVTVRILEMDANAAGAEMVAEWEVRHPADGGTLTRQITQLEAGYGGAGFSPEGAAAAYSELLRQLSDRAAEVISTNRSAEN